MKKVLSILTLAAAVVAVSVQQAYAQYIDSGLFTVASAATSNFAGITNGTFSIDVGGQRNVAIRWTVQLSGAGTEVSGIRWLPSIDGVAPTSQALNTGYYMAVAANGATPVTVHTNFDALGYRFLVGAWCTNGTSGQTLTNRIEAFMSRGANAK